MVWKCIVIVLMKSYNIMSYFVGKQNEYIFVSWLFIMFVNKTLVVFKNIYIMIK